MSYTFECWPRGKTLVRRNSKGEFIKGHRHFPKEIIEKISKSMMEKKQFLGHKHTEETKRRMSKTHKGKKFSEEHKRNISKSAVGRTPSEETRKKISKRISKWWKERKENN